MCNSKRLVSLFESFWQTKLKCSWKSMLTYQHNYWVNHHIFVWFIFIMSVLLFYVIIVLFFIFEGCFDVGRCQLCVKVAKYCLIGSLMAGSTSLLHMFARLGCFTLAFTVFMWATIYVTVFCCFFLVIVVDEEISHGCLTNINISQLWLTSWPPSFNIYF